MSGTKSWCRNLQLLLCMWFHMSHEKSGQIIATSHDLTPYGGLVREMGPLISGKSRLVKYYSIWPEKSFLTFHEILVVK